MAALERAVADLQRDVRELRAGLAAAQAVPLAGQSVAAPPAYPGAPTPPAAPPWPRPTLGARAAAYARLQMAGLGLTTAAGAEGPDVEALVGRYGTVAVAALLILTGVGAFLTWAVNTFTVTPAARVAMGVVLAAAMAGAGWRLRAGTIGADAPHTAAGDRELIDAGREGTRRFGDVLLALALAVTHVNAWAAGPFLGLVSPAAALAVAALASAALAALAWRGRQQSLFVVGVGGALVAPFVANSATGSPLTLLAYGWVVLSAGLLALPSEPEVAVRWRAAARLLALGAAAYTVALLSDVLSGRTTEGGAAWGAFAPWRRALPASFALACAAVPLIRSRRVPAAASAVMGGLALAYCATATGALLTLAVSVARVDFRLTGLALIATLGVYASVARLDHDDTTRPVRRVWLAGALVRVTAVTAALVLPLVLLAAALIALAEVDGGPGAAVAGVWALVAGLAAWRWVKRSAPEARPAGVAAGGGDRLASAHVAVAGLASALVPVLLLTGHDVVRVTLLAAHAAASVQLVRAVRRPLALLAPAVVGCAAAVWAGTLLAARPAYAYPPFLTPESIAAGAVAAAWSAIALRVWRDGERVFSRTDRRLVVAAATVVALLWGRQEFAEAVSPDVSTFLLIGYFAAAGIGAIALGRARAVPAARQVGLALALYAALKAFMQASELDSVGLRVGSYLLVGGFLLAVGYWYRAAGGRPAATGAGPTPSPDAA